MLLVGIDSKQVNAIVQCDYLSSSSHWPFIVNNQQNWRSLDSVNRGFPECLPCEYGVKIEQSGHSRNWDICARLSS